MLLDPLQLTGRSRSHVFQSEEPRFAIHADAVEPFARMREAAATEGFDIEVFSGFRDFESQAEIWNRKFCGGRTLFDADGGALDYHALSEAQRVQCILNWSALPGASRHHWGTEIDVYDRAALPDGYRVKLLPEEVQPGASSIGCTSGWTRTWRASASSALTVNTAAACFPRRGTCPTRQLRSPRWRR
jgi:LAS superfamily LD-carboxypeptidase LdcB